MTYLAWKHVFWIINDVPTTYSVNCADELEQYRNTETVHTSAKVCLTSVLIRIRIATKI